MRISTGVLLLAGACAAPESLPQTPEAGAGLAYFAGELTQEELGVLARVVPNVRVVTGLTRAQALERAAEAHGADGFYATPEFLAHATNLVWVQAMSAGVDRHMGNAALVGNERIVLTNLQGVHGPAIADHAFGMLLALTRDLRFYAREQEAARWTPGGTGRAAALEGRTMLVVGLGGIGIEIAERAAGFGMRVIATRRSDAPGPAFVERVGRSDDLLAMLPEADVIAIAVPLTAETENMFDARAFAAIKPGAILINVARGKVVDTAALLDALRSGRLAGACLDVTDPEPLPPDHPLWREPNVLITPHVASDAELTDARAWALLRENLRRFGAGEPLLNVVDKKAGY
jgi:phosphoglycerate dehydrogenase-like enzyme